MISLKDTHTRARAVGLLWSRNRPIAQTSTGQHTTPSRIRTRNTSKRTAADPRLRPRGHREIGKYITYSCEIWSTYVFQCLAFQYGVRHPWSSMTECFLLFFRKRMGQVSCIVFCTGLHVFSLRYTPEPRGASQRIRQWPAAIASFEPQIIVNGVFLWLEIDKSIKIKQSYRQHHYFL